jgi:hypothetical protein
VVLQGSDPLDFRPLRDGTPITHLQCVPSLARVLLEDPAAAPGLARLRALLLGGEAVTPDLVDGVARRSRADLINGYGPTETTVYASLKRLAPGEPVTIGRSLPGTSWFVVDGHGEPVPLGVAGQLVIGGERVARGYAGRPGLTAERFLPDHLSDHPGGRLYQTGDLARLRADGEIEYLGRLDDQVKLRGVRIELGEIETTLLSHPAVRNAAVVIPEGTQLLVAYLEASDEASAEAEALRAHLAERLPPILVPSRFVRLAALPRLGSGKVDRRTLARRPVEAEPRTVVPPRTATEAALARIWRDLLGVDEVSVDDGFFELGGHSLLVARLVARIAAELGVELRQRAIYEAPTVAAQAQRLEEARRAGVDAAETADLGELARRVAALGDDAVEVELAHWSEVELEPLPVPGAPPGPRRRLLELLAAQQRIDARPFLPLPRRRAREAPLSFAQRIQWDFHRRDNFRALGVHAHAYHLRGGLDVAALERALAALVARQEALRTVIRDDPPALRQTLGEPAALEIVDLRRFGPAERWERARAWHTRAALPHDLARASFRAGLLRLDETEHLLVLVPHHIAIDGFSWGILHDDLRELHRAAARGEPDALPPLALQFRDFCHWQRSLERRPVGERQLAFWRRMVEGAEELELPAERPMAPRRTVGLAADTAPAGEAPFRIEGPRWAELQAASARLACTPYAAIAAAWLLLLGRWAGRRDVCVNASHFQRERPGTEDVIGNFVTPYPLRVAFDARGSLDDAVRAVEAALLAGREHAGVAPESCLDAWPAWSRFKLNFLLRDRGDALRLDGLAVDLLPWNPHPRVTPWDLACFAWQGPDALAGHVLYHAERFSAETGRRAAAQLEEILRRIAAEPGARVADLPR